MNLLARLLQFPSLKYLLTHLKPLDLDVIYSAKVSVEKAIATTLEKHWLALFEKNHTKDDAYNIVNCGKRAVKNSALYYLVQTEKPVTIDLAFEQASHATNMTDQLGALIALNNHAVSSREKALSQFYDRYQHEPLVVNKWLSLHASTTLPSALKDVKQLTKHAAFDIQNPNNVYALLVTFGSNTLRFHDKSGDGYVFLADQVLTIDAKNPQVAARVLQPLTQWRQMDEARGSLMKAQLERLSTEKLSDNVFEIVNKSIENHLH